MHRVYWLLGAAWDNKKHNKVVFIMRNNSWTTDGRERSEEGCRQWTAPLTVRNKVLHGNRTSLYDTYTYWKRSMEAEMVNVSLTKSLPPPTYDGYTNWWQVATLTSCRYTLRQLNVVVCYAPLTATDPVRCNQLWTSYFKSLRTSYHWAHWGHVVQEHVNPAAPTGWMPVHWHCLNPGKVDLQDHMILWFESDISMPNV